MNLDTALTITFRTVMMAICIVVSCFVEDIARWVLILTATAWGGGVVLALVKWLRTRNDTVA